MPSGTTGVIIISITGIIAITTTIIITAVKRRVTGEAKASLFRLSEALKRKRGKTPAPLPATCSNFSKYASDASMLRAFKNFLNRLGQE